MGIKRMNKFLDEKQLIKSYNNLNEMIRNSKQSEYKVFNTRNKCYRLGIDTMLYAHKFKYSYNDIIYGFTNQILNFLNNRILPIYIIDGVAPDEKSDLIKYRNDKKNKIDKKIENLKFLLENEVDQTKIRSLNNKIKNLNRSNIKITKDDINNIITLLKKFNIPYVRAKGEADALIGSLYEKKLIDSCLSEDMDILVFGCKKMIKFSNKKIYEYDLDHILDNLNLTLHQYIDMCIYFGCDYLRPVMKNASDEIYNSILNNTTNDLLENNLQSDNFTKYICKFNRAKDIFLNAKKIENTRYSAFQLKEQINFDDAIIFLKKHTNISNNKISDFEYNIQYINGLISDNKFY